MRARMAIFAASAALSCTVTTASGQSPVTGAPIPFTDFWARERQHFGELVVLVDRMRDSGAVVDALAVIKHAGTEVQWLAENQPDPCYATAHALWLRTWASVTWAVQVGLVIAQGGSSAQPLKAFENEAASVLADTDLLASEAELAAIRCGME